jgi:hypothetical protein
VKRYLVVVLLALFSLMSSWSAAATMELGVRGGKDTTTAHGNFTAGELYYLHTLPWQKQLSQSTTLYTRLDAGAGYLHADSQSGGWLAVGVDVVLGMMGDAWELEGGFRPAWLFESELGGENFGGPVQFSSHVGATLNLGQVALSYRFQHISNASIYDCNPGINLNLIGLGVRF